MKSAFGGKIGHVLLLLVVLLLVGLPLAVWLDLTNLAESNLTRQASDLNSIIASVRAYYASNVVGRILAAPGVATQVVHNYEDIPGAIPIPATLSLELGRVISERQHNITYRFVSDYPFANRAPHPLDQFEADALHRLRENPNQVISLNFEFPPRWTAFAWWRRSSWPPPVSPATTPTRKASSATGKSATCAACRK